MGHSYQCRQGSHRRARCFVVGLIAVAVVAGVVPASWATPGASSSDAPEAAHSDEVRAIVELAVDLHPEGELRPRDRARQRQALAAAQQRVRRQLVGTDHHVVRELRRTPYLVVDLSRDALVRLRDAPGVVRVLPDETYTTSLVDSVPHIEADQLWDLGFEGIGTQVAILDTGVDATHPFLAGKVVAEACFSDGDPSVPGSRLCPDGTAQQEGPGAAVPCSGIPDCGHGSHVAGIAAGLRDVGPGGGVAPGTGLLSVQVFHGAPCGSDGSDLCLEANLSDLMAALEWVYDKQHDHDIAAVNLSLGGGQQTAVCDNHPLKGVVDLLRSVGIATVVATGNAGRSDAVAMPACISSVLAVGATTLADEVPGFSNLHPEMVDLVAPGVGIVSSVPGGYVKADGTSMAAPHVSGALALLREWSHDASVTDLLDVLQHSGVQVTDDRTATAATFPRLALRQVVAPDLVAGEVCTAPPFDDVPIEHPFCPEIGRLRMAGLVEGFPDGSFRPGQEVTRQAVAAFLHRAAGAPPVTPDERFSDVPIDHPFASEITWLAQAGLTDGYPDGTFRPRQPVTRQALIAFLFRAAGEPDGDWEVSFLDVSDDHPFTTEIGWAATTGVATGFEDGTFLPTRAVTRQASAAFLDRMV